MIAIDMPMPTECHECRFCIKYKDGVADDFYNRRCVIEGRTIAYPRPDWCPLRDAATLKAAEIVPVGFTELDCWPQMARENIITNMMKRLRDDGVVEFCQMTEAFTGRDVIVGKLNVVFPRGMSLKQGGTDEEAGGGD